MTAQEIPRCNNKSSERENGNVGGEAGEINKGIIEEHFSELRDVWVFKIEKIH